MKSISNRLAKLEAADPVPVRFVMVGALAPGELPAPGRFTFTLDRPRAERREEEHAAPQS